MRIQFKIFRKDIIDCSSCHNTIYPDPESRDILLQILLKVCESDVVSRIGQFTVRLDTLELQSPMVKGWDDRRSKEGGSGYEFLTDKEAEQNKISGLFVENEEDAKERIKNLSYFKSYKTTKAYYIKPGLEGIRKAISYITDLYNYNRDNLPNHLRYIKLRHFSFSMGVIWKMNEHWTVRDGVCDYISYEHDTLGCDSSDSGFGFGFGNFGGDSLDIYYSPDYLEHLDAIQKILDEIAPGTYEADPLDRDELLQAGFLKREGRNHVKISMEEGDKLVENFDNILFRRELKEDYRKKLDDDEI